MKLEYLYPELGNLYGDGANLGYLQKCLPEAETVETHLGDKPAFASDPEVVFLYSGPMTERGQGIALEALRPSCSPGWRTGFTPFSPETAWSFWGSPSPTETRCWRGWGSWISLPGGT